MGCGRACRSIDFVDFFAANRWQVGTALKTSISFHWARK
jgi:hypothetical protein